MKKDSFQKLNVGDKIKFESFDGIKIGKITETEEACLDVQAVYGDSLKEYFVTRRQVISRIVKRKKPKLEFVGYVEQYIHEGLEVSYSSLCTEIGPFNTHEVFVRPIVRNK